MRQGMAGGFKYLFSYEFHGGLEHILRSQPNVSHRAVA